MKKMNKKLNKKELKNITVKLKYNEWEEVLLAMILLMTQRKKDKQKEKAETEKIYNSIRKQLINEKKKKVKESLKKIIKKEAEDQA